MRKNAITTHPNQRVYRTLSRNMPGEQRVQVDKKYIYAAYRILRPMELMVWLDLISNMADYTWTYSSQDMSNKYGMSVSGAKQAFSGLIAKGFATHVSGNAYEIQSFTMKPEYDEIYDLVSNLNNKKSQDDDYAWTKK